MRTPRAAVAVAVLLSLAAPGVAHGQAARRVDRRHDQQELGHRETAWERKGFAPHRAGARALAAEYREFLGRHRTEREVIAAALARARKAGFADLFAPRRPRVRPGARLYAQVHGKLAALVVVGRRPLDDGLRVVAAHIDAVRIDLKQDPLYAEGNLALLQTHYYGSLKKYQWLSEPLELRGVVVTKDGKAVEVAIGDDPGEPVLVIPDLGIHAGGAAVDRAEGEEVHAEKLDPIVGSTAAGGGRGADPFAAEAARLLERELGIQLGDLASAELSLVPAAPVREVGLDRALIGGYGQDDRACAFAALRAVLEVRAPEHTAIVVLTDKEEVGSPGATGAQSNFVRRVVSELIEGSGRASTERAVDRALAASTVWSAGATGAVNPHYPELYEAQNAAYLGSGVVWDHTGAAEVRAHARRLLDRAGIAHQAAGRGKSEGTRTDGGTVLRWFTRLGMSGLNVGVPILSMHAPFELVSIADLYEVYRAYRAFLLD